MKITVIGSCGARKKLDKLNSDDPLNCYDLIPSKINALLKNYKSEKIAASELYLGMQHIKLMEGIKALRKTDLFEIDYFILSAGFGLISERKKLPAYDCSFNSMNKKEIIERAQRLNIPSTFQQIVKKGTNLLYLALGQDYLRALGSWDKFNLPPTIAFTKTKNPSVVSLQANSQTVKSFSEAGFSINGVTGFKGNLFLIFINKLLTANNPVKEFEKTVSSNKKLLEGFSLKNFQSKLFD